MKVLACSTNFITRWLELFKNSKIAIKIFVETLIIQIIFNNSYRGFYNRKYEHDFYARKNYLDHVGQKVSIITDTLFHSYLLFRMKKLGEH